MNASIFSPFLSGVILLVSLLPVLGQTSDKTVVRSNQVASSGTIGKDRSEEISAVQQELCKLFDDLLADPASYKKTAKRECGSFPEGTLYPYTFPALAYANMAFADRI